MSEPVGERGPSGPAGGRERETRTGHLDGRTVLITGAGDGLGRGIALACAGEGAHVIATSRGDNGLETVRLVEQQGGAATWARCDVTDDAEVEAAVATAVESTGRLDAFVHNATSRRSSEVAALADVDLALWEDHASVSLRASWRCARAALPQLQAHGGCFILMTSPAGIEGSAAVPVYGMVKGALRGFAKSLAREWAPLGVTVTLVSPLAMTPALENAYVENPALEERLRQLVPMGRIGDPQADIGAVVAFLAGDGARYITGQTLVVDGGRFMGL